MYGNKSIGGGGNRYLSCGSAPIVKIDHPAGALSESRAFLIRMYRIACQRGSRVALGSCSHTIDVIASFNGSGRTVFSDLRVNSLEEY